MAAQLEASQEGLSSVSKYRSKFLGTFAPTPTRLVVEREPNTYIHVHTSTLKMEILRVSKMSETAHDEHPIAERHKSQPFGASSELYFRVQFSSDSRIYAMRYVFALYRLTSLRRCSTFLITICDSVTALHEASVIHISTSGTRIACGVGLLSCKAQKC
jgi:hypothetical protein